MSRNPGDDRRCSTCAFFIAGREEERPGHGDDTWLTMPDPETGRYEPVPGIDLFWDDVQGECRRYPPGWHNFGKPIYLRADHWCGEWRPA